MKELLIRNDRCLGCRSCELGCATEHSQSKNLLAAITEKPRPRYRVHVAGDGKTALPLQCRNCEEATCLTACLSGALYRDERDIVVCNGDLCVGCFMCVMVCPFGVITLSNESRRIIKCDRCPDRKVPACVSSCPTGALIYTELDAAARGRRRTVLARLKNL
jgi:carbon-monoxide dehydrogenase iron sulfur subunit